MMFWTFWTLLTLVLLLLLGVLGIASWLKTRQPNLSQQIGKLEAVEGVIGLVGLVWGLVLLLRWLESLGYYHSLNLVSLIIALALLSLSLILALPQLRSMIGSNDFTSRLSQLAGKLAPYKMVLGVVCLVLALYLLLSFSGMRAF
jgi:hypothetical protein